MRRRLAVLTCYLLPLLWLFRGVLSQCHIFAFRDSAFYYFPFYLYIERRWADGFPLWNPWDGLGQPLWGDPTAAVVYPLKLFFLLPLEYAHCFAIYVVMHLVIAAYGAYAFARRLKAVPQGAVLAGFTYSLSGQVLFQYCNPIYLVGAAWLPWAMCHFYGIVVHRHGRIEHRKWYSVVGLSLTLCMMTLGGDPQMALHTALCGGLWFVIARWPWAHVRFSWTGWLRRLGQLALACVLGLLLSSIQVFPSQEWVARSDRAENEYPMSLWEVAWNYQATGRWEHRGLWNRETHTSDHARKAYQFSVGPWRWCELFWPNITGQLAPISTRWIKGLPGEGRMWVPSLYLGLLPVLMAIARSRWRRGSLAIRWISWMTLLSVLAAMGEYGLGWLLDEWNYPGADNYQSSSLLRGLGGVYWWMTVTVPNYAEFRYPAKWWTVATLGISVLAARGWPLLSSMDRPRWMNVLGIKFSWTKVLAIALGSSLLLVGFVRVFLVREIPPGTFGPFDAFLSLWHVAQSISHTVCMAVIFFLVLRGKSRRWKTWILVASVVDIMIAQHGMIYSIDEPMRPTRGEHFSMWRESGHQYPVSFRTTRSGDRLREALRHDLETLMPKYHLLTEQRQLNSVSSMRCQSWAQVLELDRELTSPSARKRLRSWFAPNQAGQRAWLASDWQAVAPDTFRMEVWLAEQCRGETDDFHRRPVVELVADKLEFADDKLDVAADWDTIPEQDPTRNQQAVVSEESVCLMAADTPELVKIEVETRERSLLVLRDQYFPGWSAEIITYGGTARPVPIHRVNGVLRGVFIPPGRSVVTFHYSPTSLQWGGLVSLAASLAIVLLLWKQPVDVESDV